MALLFLSNSVPLLSDFAKTSSVTSARSRTGRHPGLVPQYKINAASDFSVTMIAVDFCTCSSVGSGNFFLFVVYC